jgi:hypothetical protein
MNKDEVGGSCRGEVLYEQNVSEQEKADVSTALNDRHASVVRKRGERGQRLILVSQRAGLYNAEYSFFPLLTLSNT